MLMSEWRTNDRPWVDIHDQICLKSSVTTTVQFPDGDPTTGEIRLYCLGPQLHMTTELMAIKMMNIYLSEGPASYLQRALVENEDPLATGVYNP